MTVCIVTRIREGGHTKIMIYDQGRSVDTGMAFIVGRPKALGALIATEFAIVSVLSIVICSALVCRGKTTEVIRKNV
jgi:hypothetical protein